jgi:hypothetical protein
MGSIPIGRVVVVRVATPLAFRVALPRLVDPFENVTVPVGVVVPDCEVTVAVRVTVCPTVAVVGDAWSVV